MLYCILFSNFLITGIGLKSGRVILAKFDLRRTARNLEYVKCGADAKFLECSFNVRRFTGSSIV